MVSGAPAWARAGPLKTLRTMADLDRYCYYIAGTVGYLLTDLFFIHSPHIGQELFYELQSRRRGLRARAPEGEYRQGSGRRPSTRVVLHPHRLASARRPSAPTPSGPRAGRGRLSAPSARVLVGGGPPRVRLALPRRRSPWRSARSASSWPTACSSPCETLALVAKNPDALVAPREAQDQPPRRGQNRRPMPAQDRRPAALENATQREAGSSSFSGCRGVFGSGELRQ